MSGHRYNQQTWAQIARQILRVAHGAARDASRRRSKTTMLLKLITAALLMVFCSSAEPYPFHEWHNDSASVKDRRAQDISPTIRDNYITTTDGAQIHSLQAGKPTSAPAIIFIPGWTLSASLWNQQLRKFSAGRLAIAVESRSQGESSKMPIPIKLYGNFCPQSWAVWRISGAPQIFAQY
jgi:hypothetical protein